MGLLDKLKNVLYKRFLQKAIKKNTSYSRDLINIAHANTIGILYNASLASDTALIAKYQELFKQEGKKVTCLGFQNTKEKEALNKQIFDKTSVSWYHVPSGEKITTFQNKAFDILICAFNKECLPLEYIAANSKAKCRVGIYNKEKTSHYELMLNIAPDKDLDFLIQQALHFLKEINKDEK